MTVPPPKTVGVAREVTAPTSSVSSPEDAPAIQGPTDTALSVVRVVMRMPLLLLIRLYQRTLSLDHGPLSMFVPYGYCRFHPTCSQYGYEAIEQRGILVGIALTGWRILRCNPYSHGGVDPVPEKGFKRATRKK